MMEAFIATALQEGEDARAKLPQEVESIQDIIRSEFTYSSLQQMESDLFSAIASSLGEASENDKMVALVSQVRDRVTRTVNILLALRRWIRVQVPKIEDGNNFGVSVQLDVSKKIEDLTAPLTKALDDLPGYFENRATAWDKVAVKSSKETKSSSSSAEEKGGKDGPTVKTSESSSTEKTSKSWTAPDSSRHLVALDVKWFVTLHHLALMARDALLIAGDTIEKNMEKLQRPKGSNTRGGGMYSF